MSKSNDSSKLGRAKLEDRALADTELDVVTGGGTAVSQSASQSGLSGGFRGRYQLQLDKASSLL